MAEVLPELAAEIQKLARYHAENPQGRYFVPLANAYRKAGELEQAEALLREGLRRHPDYLSAHIVLGRCLADRGAAEEAATEFRYVLGVDPQNLIALRSLGELAAERGEGREAIRWYRELLAVDPMNEEARQALETLEAAPSAPAPEEPGPDEGMLDDALGWGTWGGAPAEPAEPADTGAGDTPDDLMSWGEVRLDAEPAPAAPEPAAPSGGGWDPFAGGTIDLDTGGEPEAPGAEPEEEEVVTETIAELYARQGFYDRAADVYRELLRRRGDDARLRERLAEVEGLAAGHVPAAADGPADEEYDTADDLPLIEGGDPLPMLDVDFGTAFAPGGEEEPAPAAGTDGDAFADSFASGFGPDLGGGFGPDFEGEEVPAAGIGGDLAEPQPAAESSPPPAPMAAPAGGTVRDYFAGLLAWSPGGAPAAAPAAPAGEAPAEPQPEAEPEPGVAEDLPWLTLPEVEPEPKAAPAAEPEPPAPPAAAADPGELFPWELSMEPTPEPQPGEGAGARDETSFSFEEFFPAPTAVPAPPPAPEPEPRAETAPPPAPAPPAQPEPQAESTGGEDDEDLESFQAWLQSLKK
jgi:tetratricopeptide (TPR) repeat protein